MWRGTSLQLDGGASLQRTTSDFSGEKTFETAAPLSIRLRGVNVAEDYESVLRGKNDIIVVTKTWFGNEPPVSRVHKFESIDPGWYDAFVYNVMLSLRDLRDEILTVRVQVYEIDGVPSWVLEEFNTLEQAMELVLPDIGPLSDTYAEVGKELLELVDALDQHKQVLDDQISLQLAEPDTGRDVLQPGYFVCFDEPPANEEYELKGGTRVFTSDGDPYDGNYAVLEFAKDRFEKREQERSQKAAKLMAEVNGKGQSESKAAVDFLRDTMRAYTDHRKVERAENLSEKSKSDRTAAEQQLLEDLRNDDSVGHIVSELY
jgi:hypothetical protein